MSGDRRGSRHDGTAVRIRGDETGFAGIREPDPGAGDRRRTGHHGRVVHLVAGDPIGPGLVGVVDPGLNGDVDPGQVPGRPSNVEAAGSVACRANVRIIEEAMARKQAVDGTPATSIEELMA
jgi:hypothetical protein